MNGYPVSLGLEGRRVVVVGGGAVATRRVDGLLAAGATIFVVAPELTPALREWALGAVVAVAERTFEPDDVDGAWLVLAATGDGAVNRAVVEAATARRCFVSSADGAEASFRPMSVLRRGDLEVAVGTNGRSPALALWLRQRLEGELGPEYGVLLELMAEVRSARPTVEGDVEPDADWREVIGSGILDAIRTGRLDDARRGLRACHSSSSG